MSAGTGRLASRNGSSFEAPRPVDNVSGNYTYDDRARIRRRTTSEDPFQPPPGREAGRHAPAAAPGRRRSANAVSIPPPGREAGRHSDCVREPPKGNGKSVSILARP